MRRSIFLLILIYTCLLHSGIAKQSTLPKLDPRELEELEKTQNLRTNLEKLQKIKYFITNGHLGLAKYLLTKQEYFDEKVFNLIKLRYLATVYFLEGDYQKSYETLSLKEFNRPADYALVCQLRILNRIILDKTNDLKSDYRYCLSLNQDFFQQSLWFDHLVNLKLRDDYVLSGQDFKNVYQYSQQSDELKIWLKLALYLNQEKKLFEIMPKILLDAYRDPEVRELIGLIYYRMGQYKKSYEFIEDLDTANAENIKGNLLLSKQKLELAYGHFKLALQKKQNSYNALERAVSLAWLLGQWQDGEQLGQKLRSPTGKERQKLTLQSAFLSKLKKYPEALQLLQQMTANNPSGLPLEINQLYSFNAFMQKDLKGARQFSDLACKKYDGLNCALLLQLHLWPELPLMMERSDPTFSDKELTVENLKSKAELKPIEEDILINQKEIEELEDQTISVISN